MGQSAKVSFDKAYEKANMKRSYHRKSMPIKRVNNKTRPEKKGELFPISGVSWCNKLPKVSG